MLYDKQNASQPLSARSISVQRECTEAMLLNDIAAGTVSAAENYGLAMI